MIDILGAMTSPLSPLEDTEYQSHIKGNKGTF